MRRTSYRQLPMTPTGTRERRSAMSVAGRRSSAAVGGAARSRDIAAEGMQTAN